MEFGDPDKRIYSYKSIVFGRFKRGDNSVSLINF